MSFIDFEKQMLDFFGSLENMEPVFTILFETGNHIRRAAVAYVIFDIARRSENISKVDIDKEIESIKDTLLSYIKKDIN